MMFFFFFLFLFFFLKKIQELETAATTQEAKVVAMQERLNDTFHTVEQFRALVQAQQDKLAAHEQKEGELAEKASVLMAESRVLMVLLAGRGNELCLRI
jgi:hypothetical protein